MTDKGVTFDINDFWDCPPAALPMPTEDVHLWRCALDIEKEFFSQLWQILSEDEQERANRFHFDDHRRRFVVARAALKTVIARYLQIKSVDVAFVLGDRGKPAIVPSLPAQGLQFNISHSHELALFGFVCDRNIGVDLEYLRPVKEVTTLAERFFCPREAAAIAKSPIDRQASDFLQIWTAKEAFLKGIGSGISGGLDSIEITLNPDLTLDFTLPHPQNLPQTPWQLFNLDLGKDYLATIAIENFSGQRQTWQVNPLIDNVCL